MNKLKKCCKCKLEKPRSLFYADNSRRDGKKAWCKECHYKWEKEYKRKFDGKLREYYKNYHSEYYKKNKDRLKKIFRKNYILKKNEYRERNKKTYFRRYGITYENAISTWEKQKKKCAICNVDMVILGTNGKRGFCVDHDHKTGRFRGILCHSCNSAIGLFKENIENIKQAVNYLDKFINHMQL